MYPKLLRLLAVLLIVGLGLRWTGSNAGQARSKLAPGLAASSPACYSWDFLNNTGSDATELHINLKGIQSLTDVYTGVLNPFGAPDPSSGYNSATDVYSLIFTGGTVPDSGGAQIGICASQPALRLDSTQPAFYWVVSGSPAAPDPLFAGLDFNWINSNHLQVHLYNEQATPLTAYSFSVLMPTGPLALDDLNDGVTSTLPVASDQISDPLDLAGGASQTFDIFLGEGSVYPVFGSPIVLEAVLSAQDDPGNTIHLIAQTAQPFATIYMPAVKK